MEYRDGKGDKIGMPCTHMTVITQYGSKVRAGVSGRGGVSGNFANLAP